MNARSAKGKRWAWNVMKVVGLVIVLWLVFVFRGNALKGMVEAGMLLLVGLACAGIAFAMGWLSAGGGAQPNSSSGGSASAPAGDAGPTATAAGGGSTENAKDSDAPVAPMATSAREPGVADFDGARQRHELNAIVDSAFAAYPFLNDNNEEFDQGALDEIMKFRDFYLSAGYTLPDALRKAIAEVGPRSAGQRIGQQP